MSLGLGASVGQGTGVQCFLGEWDKRTGNPVLFVATIGLFGSSLSLIAGYATISYKWKDWAGHGGR